MGTHTQQGDRETERQRGGDRERNLGVANPKKMHSIRKTDTRLPEGSHRPPVVGHYSWRDMNKWLLVPNRESRTDQYVDSTVVQLW